MNPVRNQQKLKRKRNPTISNGVKRPHVILFSGYGLNTEDETKAAFESVGATADIVHLNDVIARPNLLKKAHIIVFGGGFAYGDDTGAGKAYGNRVKAHLGGAFQEFLTRDTLMLGICNGFQILTSAGILPGALISNDMPRYICRWVDLKVENDSPWLRGITSLSLPIAHCEGKYYAPPVQLALLSKASSIGVKYTKGEMYRHFDLPANPNGSLEDIAGVLGHGGRVLGLMPHPERAVRFTALPHWTLLREEYVRKGKEMPKEGPGIQLFRNAVQYFL